MNLLIYFIIVGVCFILLNIVSRCKFLSKIDRDYMENQRYYNPAYLPFTFLIMSWSWPITIIALIYLCFFSSSFNRYEE